MLCSCLPESGNRRHRAVLAAVGQRRAGRAGARRSSSSKEPEESSRRAGSRAIEPEQEAGARAVRSARLRGLPPQPARIGRKPLIMRVLAATRGPIRRPHLACCLASPTTISSRWRAPGPISPRRSSAPSWRWSGRDEPRDQRLDRNGCKGGRGVRPSPCGRASGAGSPPLPACTGLLLAHRPRAAAHPEPRKPAAVRGRAHRQVLPGPGRARDGPPRGTDLEGSLPATGTFVTAASPQGRV